MKNYVDREKPHMKYQWTCITLASLLCMACASAPTGDAPSTDASPSADATQAPVKTISAERINSWQISGAMAARNLKKAWTASINWQQRGQGQYDIRLSGPLGSGTVMIAKQGGRIILKDGPKTVTSNNAEAMLLKQTGVRLPVSQLYYWVRGIPAPGNVGHSQKDSQGRLISLSQGGYQIDYSRYINKNNVALPGFIKLQGRGVLVKLVINRWNF